MKLTLPTLVLLAALAGCGVIKPNDTAQMPNNPQGGPEMNQNEAIATAAWVLENPEVSRGNPARGARAVAAEDWLAGQWRLTEDFGPYAPLNEVSWNRLRREVRAAIGVAPNTPSQVIVDHLIAASHALQAGDTAAAEAQLQSPVFTFGPQRTLAVLGNLPHFPGTQTAFYELNRNENRSTGNCFMSAC